MTQLMAPVELGLPDGGRVRVLVQEYVERAALEAHARHPRNPRRGNTALIDESIAHNGFYGAGVVWAQRGALFGVGTPRGKRWILAGAHRHAVLEARGVLEWPVLLVQCPPDVAERIVLADNRARAAGRLDDAMVAQLLDLIVDRVGEEGLAGTGYDAGLLRDLHAFAELGPNVPGFLDDSGLGSPTTTAIPDDRKLRVRVGNPSFTAKVVNDLRELLAQHPEWRGVVLHSGF